MRILTAIILVAMFVSALNAQIAAERSPDSAGLPDWSRLFPTIPGCEIGESSFFDNRQGRSTQKVSYRIASDVVSIASDAAPVVLAAESEHNCPSFELEVTYPFTPPQPPSLTKEQLREQKKIAERMRKGQKKLRKLYELMPRRPGPPSPRLFVFKGFPAVQSFGGPCDYIPCESDWIVRVSVKFSSDKTLMITVRGNFERTEEILNAVDFAELDATMTKWVKSKNLESKK